MEHSEYLNALTLLCESGRPSLFWVQNGEGEKPGTILESRFLQD